MAVGNIDVQAHSLSPQEGGAGAKYVMLHYFFGCASKGGRGAKYVMLQYVFCRASNTRDAVAGGKGRCRTAIYLWSCGRCWQGHVPRLQTAGASSILQWRLLQVGLPALLIVFDKGLIPPRVQKDICWNAASASAGKTEWSVIHLMACNPDKCQTTFHGFVSNKLPPGHHIPPCHVHSSNNTYTLRVQA